MGDPRRFDVFADEIARRCPDRSTRIVDVAAGKGGMHAALYRLGYRNVVCFDRRPRKAHRPYYRHELFRADIPERFDFVIGMHPDGGTDEAIEYALRNDVPYLVVPCCTRPSAWRYDGPTDQDAWISHLVSRSGALMTRLPMNGANRMLVGGSVTATEEGE